MKTLKPLLWGIEKGAVSAVQAGGPDGTSKDGPRAAVCRADALLTAALADYQFRAHGTKLI